MSREDVFHAVKPLTRRLVRLTLAALPPDTEPSSLEVLLAVVGELECVSDDNEEDGSTEGDEELCIT